MIAPVQPKPTITASTGVLRIVIASILDRPSGATPDTHRRKWIGATVSQDVGPLIVACARKANHFPGGKVAISTVERVGEIALHHVLQQELEPGFTIDIAT